MPRPCCEHCGLHPNICVCGYCGAVQNRTSLTVLQHPSEVGQSKGTLRILQQCLGNLHVFVGETPEDFRQSGFTGELCPDTTAVLFPGPDSQPVEATDLSQINHWIVLDGTWRKAAKLLHLNPGIGELPRFHFACPPASRYIIRKAPGEHHLSTAEAVHYLLKNQEPGLDAMPIQTAMTALIEKQLSQIPRALRDRYQ